MNKHSRMYQELQGMIEYRAWIRWHKIVCSSAVIGLAIGMIIGLIK